MTSLQNDITCGYIDCLRRPRELFYSGEPNIGSSSTRRIHFAPRGLGIAIGLSAMLLLLNAAPAYGRPLPKMDEPLQVEGSVRTLNDALNAPFHWTGGAYFNPGETSISFTINVPTRKRLVVELLSLHTTLPPGQRVIAVMVVSGQHVHLPLQSQGVFENGEIFSGTFSLTLRIDGTGKPGEISFLFKRNSPADNLQRAAFATVNGYLVDI